MNIYKIGTCNYCDADNEILRPSPFMADRAMMCEHCWNDTKEEYAASNGEHIPDFDNNKEDYLGIKKSVENGITVYKMFLEDMQGYIDSNIENFREELRVINEDYFMDELEKHINIEFVMKSLALMNLGDEFSYKSVKFKCFKMAEEIYKNLPEFNGW
ncbi:hypothetical protein IAI10_16675 [Clostridium sp. 19966]|uniref:hypothetical protein n=1 Tax=Clostridium sp. 19966 TaxID=2768166 RepID=UPI0028DD7CA7|nr:hypothetical protein [Clostridium sp. 19966]MDT8718304.1 hypothetical protein [Clostridium sp. 19966]